MKISKLQSDRKEVETMNNQLKPVAKVNTTEIFHLVNENAEGREQIRRLAIQQEEARRARKEARLHRALDKSIHTAMCFGASVMAMYWCVSGLMAVPLAFPLFCSGLVMGGLNLGKAIKEWEAL